MNDERSNADRLSRYVDDLHANDAEAATTPEAQLAADLHRLAASIEPPADLMQRLLPPLHTNGQPAQPQPTSHEERLMTAVHAHAQTRRTTTGPTQPLIQYAHREVC